MGYNGTKWDKMGQNGKKVHRNTPKYTKIHQNIMPKYTKIHQNTPKYTKMLIKIPPKMVVAVFDKNVKFYRNEPDNTFTQNTSKYQKYKKNASKY